MHLETHSRTMMKSITWRITAVVSTFLIIALLTHDYRTSLYYTIIINIIKSFLYYGHERLWSKSSYGIKNK